jgi:hypothetical protein
LQRSRALKEDISDEFMETVVWRGEVSMKMRAVLKAETSIDIACCRAFR